MTSNRGVLGNKLNIFFKSRLNFCFMKSVVILAKCLCASIILSMCLFVSVKWKQVRNLVWTHCCSCWSLTYNIADLFSSGTLCYWDFTYENFWGKIHVQKDLRKTASLVITLCLACSPVAILYRLVVIRLFRVTFKPNHCCDMPVMLPDPVAQQFKPQKEFSG